MKTLVAGFGQVLRGDDGFGVAVIRRLRELHVGGADVELLEVGAAGLRLAQELLDPYDRVIVVDAVTRGGVPGTVYTLAVDGIEPADAVDMHTAVPERALAVAKALGALPGEVWIVGCEPGEIDELTMELTPPVRAAVDEAVARVRALLRGGELDLGRRDEVLQVMYWLHAENLGDEVTVADILRFVDDPRAVAATLGRLVADGWAAMRRDGGGARYRLTPGGAAEGRRRFLDEFEPFLARRGHGECGDAACDCHSGGECRGLP